MFLFCFMCVTSTFFSMEIIAIYTGFYSPSEKIYNNGTILVSAYDNDGSVSYPAAFPFVIGVDASENQLKLDEYEFVENSIVNIRASSSFHRLKWINPQVMLAQGTSFSSVYITLKIINMIKMGYIELKDIIDKLKNGAKYVYDNIPYIPYNNEFIRNISKAIVFPFNKEVHSLARYKKILKFDILHFCDSKYSMNIGKKINQIIDGADIEDKIIDIYDICWDDNFDTVILGHCSTLTTLTKKDWNYHIISNAQKYKKQVYSFEKIFIENYKDIKNINLYYPEINPSMVPKNRFGKLRNIDKPILGIFGTSSQQGKFTLQLKLRQMFTDIGYLVGQLSTEPQGSLFGIDRIFPIGYNSTVNIQGMQSILLLNEYMWDIARNLCDIIVIGSQSGTVPYSFENLSQFPIYQRDFLLGTQPDYIILCINPHDPIEYIERNIKYIEGIIETKVIALVMFPIIQNTIDIINRFQKHKLHKEEISEKIREFKISLNYDIFYLGDEEQMKLLFNLILKKFHSEDYKQLSLTEC